MKTCDGTPQGCIVKPCNSPVPCGDCCWCLGGCEVTQPPVTAAERPDAGEGLVESERHEITGAIVATIHGDFRHFEMGKAVEAVVERILAARETAAAEAVVGRVEKAVSMLNEMCSVDSPPELIEQGYGALYDHESGWLFDRAMDLLESIIENREPELVDRAALRAGEGT